MLEGDGDGVADVEAFAQDDDSLVSLSKVVGRVSILPVCDAAYGHEVRPVDQSRAFSKKLRFFQTLGVHSLPIDAKSWLAVL